MSIVGPIGLSRVGGDAMHNLICRCLKTQQPIDLQLYIDGVTLALIWSNPVRFQCPCCGADHETKVGAAHLEPLYSNLMKRSLEPLTLQPPEYALSARGVGTLHRSRRYTEPVSDVLAPCV
jgi:hypothetical protein